MLKSSILCPKFQTRSEEELRKQSYAMHYEPDLRKVMEARTPDDLFMALSSIVGHYSYAFSSRFGGRLPNVFATYTTTKRCGNDDTAACFREACSLCRVRGAMTDWFHTWCGKESTTERVDEHINRVFGDIYPPVKPTHPQRAAMQKQAHVKLATILQGPGGSFEGSTTRYRLAGAEVIVTDNFPIPPAARVDFFSRIEKESAIHSIDPTNESLIPLFQRMCSFAQLYCFSMTREFYGNAPVKVLPGDWKVKEFDSPVCAEYRECYKCRLCQLFKDIAKLMIPSSLHATKLPALCVEINAHFHPLDCVQKSANARSLELVDESLAAARVTEHKNREVMHVDHAITTKAKRLAGQKRKDQQKVVEDVKKTDDVTPPAPRKRIRRITESPEREEPNGAQQEVIVAKLADSDLNRDLTLTGEEAEEFMNEMEPHRQRQQKSIWKQTEASMKAVMNKSLTKKIFATIDQMKTLDKAIKMVFPEAASKETIGKINTKWEAERKSSASTSPSDRITNEDIPYLRLAMLQHIRQRFFQLATFLPITATQTADWKQLGKFVSYDALMRESDHIIADNVKEVEWVRTNMKTATSLWPRAMWAIVVYQLFSHVTSSTTMMALDENKQFMVYYQIGLVCRARECMRRLDLAKLGLNWTSFQQLVTGHPLLPAFYDTFVESSTVERNLWTSQCVDESDYTSFFEGGGDVDASY